MKKVHYGDSLKGGDSLKDIATLKRRNFLYELFGSRKFAEEVEHSRI
jgi:hypothetical protein